MAEALHNVYVILSVLLFFLVKPNVAYNVLHFGARPDGRTDSTQAFQKAWAWACSSVQPVTLDVPRGTFVVRPISFIGPCKNRVTITIKGKIMGPSDYRVVARSKSWLLFWRVNGLTLNGGTIDARAGHFWSCRRHNGCNNYGAPSLSFIGCNDLVVNGLKSINSQKMHIGVDGCKNVAFKHLTISAPSGSPNTDGIHIESTTGVTIYNSLIRTGDDCISLGPGTKNVWIERISCGPGHGISIGSLGSSLNEDGVQNVTVTGAVFTKTQNGVRIKSWAKPSNGFVRGISFRNIRMYNVYNPIIIDQKYCPNNQCPHQTSSGVKISGVEYKNVKGTSASKVAVSLYCSPSNPCRGIRLQDIKLTYTHSPATSSCTNAHVISRGTVIPRGCF